MKCPSCGSEMQLRGAENVCPCCGNKTYVQSAPVSAPAENPIPAPKASPTQTVTSTLHNDHVCPRCNAMLKQLGADDQYIRYRCPSCGYMLAIPVSEEGNVEYLQRKAAIMHRITMGLADWKAAPWGVMEKDILDFVARYEEARIDLQLQMGLISCITHGFRLIDKDKYKRSKIIFKITEKTYKMQMKILKEKTNAKLYETLADYEENRARYKKVRNQYRNTKFAWKIVFFLFKKLAL